MSSANELHKFKSEVQFIYSLYLQLTVRYLIPGDWCSADEFTDKFVNVMQRREPLSVDQSKFFNFLLDNRKTFHELKNGLQVAVVHTPDVEHEVQVRVVEAETDSDVKIKLLPPVTEHNDNNKILHVKTNNLVKITHVVNMIDLDKLPPGDFESRVNLAIKSIESVNHQNVTRVAACYEHQKTRPGWVYNQLPRSARTDRMGNRHLAYIHDMLQMSLHKNDNDYILYSNLDCAITPDMYTTILNSDKPVIEFHRRDVAPVSSLWKLFRQPYQLKHTGVDAVAMQIHVYRDLVSKMLPDMLIGEPHWDTVLSNIFKQHDITYKNTTCLYHIEHEQAWSTQRLSAGGTHNKRHLHNCVEYGLIRDQLIELTGDCMNIVIDTQLHPGANIKKLCNTLNGQETSIVYFVSENSTEFRHMHIPFVNKIRTQLSPSQLHLNQTYCMINKMILSNPGFSQFNVYIFDDSKITLEPDHIISYNTFEPMNIYTNKPKLSHYLNDQGLLQDCHVK